MICEFIIPQILQRISSKYRSSAADLVDANFFLGELDPSLFPGLSSDIEVHSGFRDSHARSAADILAAVKRSLTEHQTTQVAIVGHSLGKYLPENGALMLIPTALLDLGAALALLDAVYLPLHLPSSTTFKTVGYGMPRVGGGSRNIHPTTYLCWDFYRLGTKNLQTMSIPM